MFATIALIVCSFLVATLLNVERKRNLAATHGLWVPTVWMLIVGSRSVGRWIDVNQNDYTGGSPLDQLVVTILMVLSITIIHQRRLDWPRIIRDNSWLILLFAYMGLSIIWSEFPFISLKRWIKVFGGLLMALVVLSEPRPLEALESVLRRSAYVLVPLSLLLVRYFPVYGRTYGRWDGSEMWTGVATHKNGLGQLCAISAIFLFWALMREWTLGSQLKRNRLAFSDLLVLAITVYLLKGPSNGAYSATSVSITILGVVLLVFLQWKIGARFVMARPKALVVTLVLTYLLFSDMLTETIATILNRDKNLTGRATDIWPVVLEAASHHPIFGAGYAGVWGVGAEISSKVEVEQAHNGYLDVFLQLGMVGIGLLTAFLLAFCDRVKRAFRHVLPWGSYAATVLAGSLIYNNSETSFLEYTSYLWTIMILMTVVFSASSFRVVKRGRADVKEIPEPSRPRYPR